MTKVCKSRAPTSTPSDGDGDDDNKLRPRGLPQSPTKSRHCRRRRRAMRLLAVSATATGSSSKRARMEAVGADPLSSSSSGEDADVAAAGVPEFGTISVAGRSREMEDAIYVKTELCRPAICGNRPVHYFGVYDGHGGSYVAALCRDQMHLLMEQELSRAAVTADCEIGVGSSSGMSEAVPKHIGAGEEAEWWRTRVAKCFQRMDQVALNICACGSVGFQCGCHPMVSSLTGSTAVVAIVTPEHVVVANCGDSRAVLCRGGQPRPLSFDQKPGRADEHARVLAAGGRIIYLDGLRVDGVLAMTRAIGDKFLKPAVTSEPETTITRRHPEDKFLILASDGLWDVMTNDNACQVVSDCLRESTPPATAARVGSSNTAGALYSSRSASAAALLTRIALGRGSSDNISVIVVDLMRSR